MGIAVDGNRDGNLEFGPQDVTTAQNPYRFWLNNDGDKTDGGDVQVTASVHPDSADDGILSKRDLEDFSRVQINFDGPFNLSDLTIKLLMTGVTAGSPQVRVYRAVTSGTGYVTNDQIAQDQVTRSLQQDSDSYDFTRRLVTSDEVSIPGSTLDDRLVVDENVAAMLFEGVAAGSGALTARIYFEGALVGEAKVDLKLDDIKKMYEHFTVGETIDTGDPKLGAIPTQAVPASESGTYTDQSPETDDYIMFVHGWRMQPDERVNYAETAYKRLWWQGYKGKFGLFSWPTDWVDLEGGALEAGWKAAIDNSNYARSEERAWWSGLALRQLLQEKKAAAGSGKVSVFAHSMGNVVVGSALQNAAANNLGEIVDTYVASQAAMSAHAYDGSVANFTDPLGGVWWYPNAGQAERMYPANFAGYLGGANPYLHNIDAAAGKVVNFFNPDDYALNKWLYNNAVKPLLGAYGIGYGYQDAVGYYRFKDGNQTPISFSGQTYEMFAYCATSLTEAVGAKAGVGGPFTVSEQVDLNARFAFGTDHSGQFTSTNMQRRGYWRQLLTTFGVGPTP